MATLVIVNSLIIYIFITIVMITILVTTTTLAVRKFVRILVSIRISCNIRMVICSDKINIIIIVGTGNQPDLKHTNRAAWNR